MQLLELPGARLAGLHERPDTNTGAMRLIVVVGELVLSVAVTVADSLVGIKVDAVALNMAVTEPDGTVTEVGTVSSASLLDKVTFASPGGAASVSVTMHVLAPP